MNTSEMETYFCDVCEMYLAVYLSDTTKSVKVYVHCGEPVYVVEKKKKR